MADQAQQAQMEAAKKRLADEKAARDAREAPEPGKPTPTQNENDLAALGVHITEHEPDGSPPQDPNAPQTKQAEAKRPGQTAQYQTRAARPESST